MNIAEFTKAFKDVKNMGWVKSKRKGPTGIGQTLEQLLGLSENNIALPDLGQIELKAHRISSSSMITLFTFNRKAWKMSPHEAILKYGTPDAKGRLGLYYTMAATPNSQGLFLHVEENVIAIRHISGVVVAEWGIETLAKRFMQKIPGLILISAQNEIRGQVEWFKYVRAQLLTDTSPEIIRNQLQIGNVLVDLRLHDKGTCARNHGTGFRAKEDKLPLLFKTVRDI